MKRYYSLLDRYGCGVGCDFVSGAVGDDAAHLHSLPCGIGGSGGGSGGACAPLAPCCGSCFVVVPLIAERISLRSDLEGHAVADICVHIFRMREDDEGVADEL